MSREDPQLKLRLTAEMRDEIRDAALTNGRSMNAEMVARLSGQQRTLRDEFAMAAMRAVIDTDDYQIAEGQRILALNCYQLADAMLAAREAKP